MDISYQLLLSVFIAIGATLLALIFVLFRILRKNRNYETHLHVKGRDVLERSRLLAGIKQEMQEQTMNNISKELHDNFGHSLALINMELSNLKEKATKEIQDDLDEIISMVVKLKQDNRNIFESLRSFQDQNLSISEIIRTELSRVSKAGKLQTTLDVVGNEESFPQEDTVVLFRMFQEILQNVLKHSSASMINVKMLFLKNRFQLQITDNGKGFSIDKVKRGMGLKNLEERALLIGATIHTNSVIGKGTTTEISQTLKTSNETN